MSIEETITRDELMAAMKHATHLGDIGPCGSCTDRVAEIFEYVKAHREPEYEPGEAWEDATGEKFLRSRIGDWVECSGTRLADRDMARPLRRLVPEGSQRTVTREQVEKVVEGWLGAPVGEYDDAVAFTNRIMQLLDEVAADRPRRQHVAVVRCGACQHTAPSMTEIARQQEAGMER